MFEELNGAITYLEIRKAVKQLRNGASAGSDLFLNEFFQKWKCHFDEIYLYSF